MDKNVRNVDYRVINLCFPDGQMFQGSILPQHITLRDFIEDTISRLERERRIELIYHEGLFTELSNFKIIDSYAGSPLDLNMVLEYDPFILKSIRSNQKLEMEVESDIFQTFHPTEEVKSTSPKISLEIPTIPARGDSRVRFLLSKDEIIFLSGIPKGANISHSISFPNTILDISSPVSPTPIQGGNFGYDSLIDVQKYLIDCGLVKLPVYQFESQSDSTSQLSISSSGESSISNSNNTIPSTCASPDIPTPDNNIHNPNVSGKILLNEKTYSHVDIFPKISHNLPKDQNNTNYFISNIYLVKFSLTFRSKPNIIYLECLGTQTVGELMNRLLEVIASNRVLSPNGESYSHNSSINKYEVSYKIAGSFYEIIDHEEIISNLKEGNNAEINLIQTSELSNENRRSELNIGNLISVGLYQMKSMKSEELRIARRNLACIKKRVVQERDPIYYEMPTSINKDVSKISINNYTRFFKIYKDSITKVLKADVATVSPDMLLEEIFEKHGLEQNTFKNFALRTFNKRNYLYGEKPLIYFTAIRRSLINDQELISLIVIPKVLKTSPSQKAMSSGTNRINTSSTSISRRHAEVIQIPMTKLKNLFRIRICGIENLHFWSPGITSVFLKASLNHGGMQLCNPIVTKKLDIQNIIRWNQWFTFDISVCNLPRESRIHLKVFGCDEKDEYSQDIQLKTRVYPLHAVNFHVIDKNRVLQTGSKRLNLWPSIELGVIEKNPEIYSSYGVRCGVNLSEVGSASVNPESNKSAVVILQLDEYSNPVLIPTETDGLFDESMVIELDPGSDVETIESILAKDSLSANDKDLILKYSYYCSQRACALPKYLSCINWSKAESVKECHYLLKRWCPLTLEVALSLLDCQFADEEVRILAVNYLESLPNEELQLYLLQLVQVLKFELFHDSHLAKFLLNRALRCKIIGHYYFWFIRAEIGTPEHQERYSVLLEAFLRGCNSDILSSLTSQIKFMNSMVELYQKLWSEFEDFENTVRIKEYLHSNISKITFPEKFCPIYDPLIEVGKIDQKLIRIMDSKKKPIWLEFKNNDAFSKLEHIKVLIKVGDDLRQDMLTLQMFRLMDKLWLENGLDLHLTIYGCISTGFDEGIIEIVQNAKTVCNIQREAKVIFETFQKEVLSEWLMKKNPQPGQIQIAKENFLYSCAGYCVATYILGIGDRHNDNIMLTEDGNLFHIDFGHFLGNKKKKYKLNREPVPFILTPDFIHVLGGVGSESYNRFLKISIQAYHIIRSHGALFITLFDMMKSTGLPELRGESDLAYLQESLKMDLTNEEASYHFLSLVQESIDKSLQVQISWHFHLNFTNVSQN